MTMYLRIALLVTAFLFSGCIESSTETDNKIKDGRGGVEIGNPGNLHGHVVYADSGPVIGGTVYLRSRNVMISLGDGTLKKSGASGKSAASLVYDSVITDSLGRFGFTVQDTGTFFIEARDDKGNGAFRPKVTFSKDSLKLDPIVLKPTGGVQGTLRLTTGAQNWDVIILLYGVNRFAILDSTNTFTFPGLAEGAYDIRIFSFNKNFDNYDINGIKVAVDSITVLEEITFPALAASTPELLDLSYDTTAQAVVLEWLPMDTAGIKGYNIYRTDSSDRESGYYPYRPIVQQLSPKYTLYLDNAVLGGYTYKYRVHAVLRNDIETGASGLLDLSITVPGGDTIAPEMTIQMPENGHHSNVREILIGGEVTDISGYTFLKLLVNGKEQKLKHNEIIHFELKFIYLLVALDTGHNVISLIVEDRSPYHNQTTKSIEVFFDSTYINTTDTTGPVFTLNEQYAFSGSSPIKMKFRAVDESGIEILFLNGKSPYIRSTYQITYEGIFPNDTAALFMTGVALDTRGNLTRSTLPLQVSPKTRHIDSQEIPVYDLLEPTLDTFLFVERVWLDLQPYHNDSLTMQKLNGQEIVFKRNNTLYPLELEIGINQVTLEYKIPSGDIEIHTLTIERLVKIEPYEKAPVVSTDSVWLNIGSPDFESVNGLDISYKGEDRLKLVVLELGTNNVQIKLKSSELFKQMTIIRE